MMYVAYRVERGVYDSDRHVIDHNKWQVMGQRSTDLNWSKLFVAETEDECKMFALDAQREAIKASNAYIVVYNTNGYEYTESYERNKEDL